MTGNWRRDARIYDPRYYFFFSLILMTASINSSTRCWPRTQNYVLRNNCCKQTARSLGKFADLRIGGYISTKPHTNWQAPLFPLSLWWLPTWHADRFYSCHLSNPCGEAGCSYLTITSVLSIIYFSSRQVWALHISMSPKPSSSIALEVGALDFLFACIVRTPRARWLCREFLKWTPRLTQTENSISNQRDRVSRVIPSTTSLGIDSGVWTLALPTALVASGS